MTLPGARELLEALPRNRWTIVTSCTRELAEVRIRAAGLPVPPVVVTSSEIANGKPHPEPYLKGAAVLGVEAADCVRPVLDAAKRAPEATHRDAVLAA